MKKFYVLLLRLDCSVAEKSPYLNDVKTKQFLRGLTYLMLYREVS